jgi:hypothetical protein
MTPEQKKIFEDIDIYIESQKLKGEAKTQERYEELTQFIHGGIVWELFGTLPDDLWETDEESRPYFDRFYDSLDELKALSEEYASLYFLGSLFEANEELNGLPIIESHDISKYIDPEVIRKAKGIQLFDEETEKTLEDMHTKLYKSHIYAELSRKATEAYDTDSFYDEVELVEYKGTVSDIKPSRKKRSTSKNKT